MAAWIMRGMRLDIELAVALEIGILRLNQAAAGPQRAEAMDFNHTLWQSIRRLAATAPELSDREALLAGAAIAESATDPAELAATNATHARTLAAKAATQGALKHLIEDWRKYRIQQPDAEFGLWLLSRMDGDEMPVSV